MLEDFSRSSESSWTTNEDDISESMKFDFSLPLDFESLDISAVASKLPNKTDWPYNQDARFSHSIVPQEEKMWSDSKYLQILKNETLVQIESSKDPVIASFLNENEMFNRPFLQAGSPLAQNSVGDSPVNLYGDGYLSSEGPSNNNFSKHVTKNIQFQSSTSQNPKMSTVSRFPQIATEDLFRYTNGDDHPVMSSVSSLEENSSSSLRSYLTQSVKTDLTVSVKSPSTKSILPLTGSPATSGLSTENQFQNYGYTNCFASNVSANTTSAMTPRDSNFLLDASREQNHHRPHTSGIDSQMFSNLRTKSPPIQYASLSSHYGPTSTASSPAISPSYTIQAKYNNRGLLTSSGGNSIIGKNEYIQQQKTLNKITSLRRNQMSFSPHNVNGPVYKVQFKRKFRYFTLGVSAPGNIAVGDFVKVEADRGEGLGVVQSVLSPDLYWQEVLSTPNGKEEEGSREIKQIVRLASTYERRQLAGKFHDESQVLQSCLQLNNIYLLPMNIVDVEFQFDRHKLIVYYDSTSRIDFREFVRDLFAVYKTRIWMQHNDAYFVGDNDLAYALSTGNLVRGSSFSPSPSLPYNGGNDSQYDCGAGEGNFPVYSQDHTTLNRSVPNYGFAIATNKNGPGSSILHDGPKSEFVNSLYRTNMPPTHGMSSMLSGYDNSTQNYHSQYRDNNERLHQESFFNCPRPTGDPQDTSSYYSEAPPFRNFENLRGDVYNPFPPRVPMASDPHWQI